MKVKEESEKVGLKLNIQKTNIMASGPITSWEIDRETVETERHFILGGLQNHCRCDCNHEIKRHLLLGRKAMIEVDRPMLTLLYSHCILISIKCPSDFLHSNTLLLEHWTWFYFLHAAAAAKLLQSCPTLGNPMDCNLPGFSAHGILQARTLEWVAISFSICMLDKGIKLNAES